MQAAASLSRRALLQLALTTLLPATATATAGQQLPDDGTQSGNLFISGARRGPDEHVAVVFDEQARRIASIPLSARAHGAASHRASHQACLFARRPGLYLHAFDRRDPERHLTVAPVAGRHFYGHGSYSADGRLLFATENDFDAQRGVLGIYDTAAGYQRLGEMDTGGTGPHEVVRIPGSALLIVANGGIHTHPDTGREKLNIDSMAPSLTVVDSRNGDLLARHVLPAEWHQVSLRHLAVDVEGNVWFAGQYEGAEAVIGGLAGVMSVDRSLRSFQRGRSSQGLSLVELPADLQQRTSHYLSSVAVAGDHVLFTSSKGGLMFSVDRVSAQLLETLSVRDCSGVSVIPADTDAVAASNEQRSSTLANDLMDMPSATALLTSGTGEIMALSEDGAMSLAIHRVQWDNHVYAI
ncbi:DUF1513 domain-containing protein [Granulosicoccus sp. 3-233]|uniref:DUF1513 domain-containing protein n=1 Tax=Granulosicoccus sp. 3-233 TaxID=3417969 RepID=UPI003D35919F